MNTSFIRRRRPSTRSKARMRPISDCLFLLHCLLFISCTTGFLPTPPLPLHQSRRGVHQCVIAYPRGGSLLLSTLHNDESDEESQNEDEMKESFYIRKALYSDLGDVSDIIMSSFYSGNNAKAPWRHMFRLGELNRLQQNFPYSDELHSMYVAASCSMEQVIAFVDVDARPPTRQYDPPRPYLSDLCVNPRWRRRGIAKMLIEKCEDVALNSMNKEELYIRVEQNNTRAIQMYENLSYKQQAHDYFGVKDTTMLLHKRLVVPDEMKESAVQGNMNRTQVQETLDYIV